MRKKAIFFISNLSGGGAQRTFVNILRHIDRGLFKIELVLLQYNEKDPYNSLVPNDINITSLNTRGRFAIPKIIKLLRNEKPDVVFSTLPQVNISVALAHKLSNCSAKLILRETNHREKEKMKKMTYFLLKWSYNYAYKVIALSNGVMLEMKEMYGLADSKVQVIYNPIELPKVKVESHQNSGDKLKLIACGRLVPQKNFELLIKAMIILNKKNQNWKLDILGEGEDRDHLKDLIVKNELQEKIKLIGFKDKPQQYMAVSDLFLLSSKWEGFGHVIVEAMSVGTPVLSTNCPHGPKEILGNGEYGWLAKNNDEKDFADILLFLIENRALLHKSRQIAFNRASHFEAEMITKKYENCLNA